MICSYISNLFWVHPTFTGGVGSGSLPTPPPTPCAYVSVGCLVSGHGDWLLRHQEDDHRSHIPLYVCVTLVRLPLQFFFLFLSGCAVSFTFFHVPFTPPSHFFFLRHLSPYPVHILLTSSFASFAFCRAPPDFSKPSYRCNTKCTNSNARTPRCAPA